MSFLSFISLASKDFYSADMLRDKICGLSVAVYLESVERGLSKIFLKTNLKVCMCV